MRRWLSAAKKWLRELWWRIEARWMGRAVGKYPTIKPTGAVAVSLALEHCRDPLRAMGLHFVERQGLMLFPTLDRGGSHNGWYVALLVSGDDKTITHEHVDWDGKPFRSGSAAGVALVFDHAKIFGLGEAGAIEQMNRQLSDAIQSLTKFLAGVEA